MIWGLGEALLSGCVRLLSAGAGRDSRPAREKDSPATPARPNRAASAALRGLAAALLAFAPTSAYALSAGCNAINSYGGSFTVDSAGNGTDKFTDRATQPLANGEVVTYSWSGNTKGAYLYILYTQNGSSQYAPQSVLDSAATSGSGSFTFNSTTNNASTGDYFQVGLQDTDYFTTATPKPSSRSSTVTITLSCAGPEPTITSVAPTAGPTGGATSVVITGTNFTGTTGAAGVRFGATNATGYTVNSATQITATAPAGAAGTVDIRVTNATGTSATSAADQYTYVAAPTVTAISPTAGPTAGGTTVTITGTGFAAAAGTGAVKFGATNATYTINSNTQITATSPANSAGTYDVTVTTVGGTSATSAADQYTYVAAPTVTAVSPTAGPTAGGTTVTITGTGFASANPTGAVKFGATNATYTINSNTQITATAPAGSAGTVDVRVTTAGGTSATSAADQFTYVAAPTVTSISPTAGPTGGGTTVTITGTGFSSATAVTFGATPATGFTVNSATQITATAPAGSAGTVDVRVTTVGGSSATSAADQFTYVTAPTVTSISPTAGPTSGGTTVTITGTGFAAAAGTGAVKFGATNATYTINSNTQITATSPANSAGTYDVTVTTVGGTSATSAADQYTYVAAPTVTSISPTSGPSTGGTTVTITGTGFSGATAVTFGGTAATGYTVLSGTSISATAPAGTGTVDIRVTTVGGTSATSAADQYTFVPAPTVTSVSPTSGATAGGTSVTITGTNFTGVTAVTFGGSAATGFTFNSATSITATSPAGSAGTVDIRVTTGGGTSATSAADQFTYVAAPTVTSVSPTAGPTAGGTTVTITGTGFAAAAGTGAVKFGATNATYTINSNTQITATAPANSAGTYDITVTTSGGTSATSAADQYTYVSSPTVTSVSPASGPSSGGTTVTITGTGLSGATAVTFGGTAATGFTVLSATSISATAPAGSGTVDVRVTTVGGTSATSAADQYTFIPAPTVTSITPTAGATAGGTSVTITGTNFTGVTAVTFGGSAATGFTFNSATSITATSPAGTGTVDVRVTTGGGTSATSAADQFTYITPVVISPASGALPGGTALTAYSQTFTASGGTAPYNFSSTGTLPTGLTLSAGGALSGTPTTSGTFNFTVTATDSSAAAAGANFTASQSYSIAIAKATQTINFGPLSNASLSASPLTLSATATSGLTVSFTSNTTSVCTVSGTTLTLLATGTCTVAADQAGDASYDAAPTNPQSFTVTPATLVINDAAATGLQVGASYAQANTASGGVAPYSYSLAAGAFVPGTSLDPGTGLVSGTPTVAGSFSYIIRVTDTQPVTADTPVTTVTIAKGNQTISFTSTAPSATVGGASYTVTATASSGLGVSFASATTGICTVSGNTVSFLATGTCTINADQAGDSNWNAASQAQQSFTVGNAGAVTATLGFAPASLGVGGTGTVTITFTNPNASATPNVAPLLTGSALLVRTGGVGGSCGASGADAGANFQFNGFSIPSGSCTVTLDYTGATAGSSSGQVLGAFTPSGYPTTAATPGNAFVVVPTVTGVSPPSGPVSQVVTVSGTGFSTTPGNNTVNFGAGTGNVTAASATSLTVTAPATGSGATSVTVTVNGQTSTTSGSFTFIDPPIAANKPGVAVPYNSAGTAIDLSTSISGGPHSSIAIGTAAAHGTTTISGDVVTYTPTAGYFGADSFTYTATGAGGTSNVATVGITVATPSAPVAADKNGVAIPYNSTGTGIDLSSSITGVHSSIAIGTAPAHGTVTIAGDVVTYTPTANYYGADSFTYTATGPGGTSAPANVTLVVGNPPAPVANDRNGVAVPYASSGTAIDLSGSITGVRSSIAIGTAPAHGTVTVAGEVVTYTPAATYYGADSFTYTATGPGGTSAPATVNLTVATPPAPVSADKSGVAVPYASSGTAIDLSASITGVHSSIAIGTAPAHGTVTVAGDVVTYTPAATYYGADSFTYTATGPGGTAAPSTVSVTVATPAAPSGSGTSVAVPYASSGTAIDLSGSITGVHSSIAIGTAPAHGTTTISGDVVTYTPAATYYGADSFTYTVTGPGGTSAPATVNLTVATPPAPVSADKSGVAVPYASSGTAIDLSASITGVHSSIAIGTAPAHGTVTVAGDVVTYTPAATYYGADSFTYTATGPGGTSAPSTVSVTVATPAAPTTANKSGVSVAYNSAGTPIDLAPSVTGVHNTLTISTAPAHGTVTVSGDVVTYKPTAGYYGADSFGYTATGPGGTSAASTVSLTVANPPPPVAAPGSGSVAGSTTTAGTSVNIDLSALVTGVYDTIQIATPPAHGTVTLSGGTPAGPAGKGDAAPATPIIATYTPAPNYAGTDSFTYVAVGPGGSSAPGTVTITVVGQVPIAVAKVATTGDGQMVSVMLTDGATRGPITGATVVSVSPANSASTAIVATGTGSYRLDVTPNNRFGGQIVVTYTLSNIFGASAPSTVTLTVQARPDPRNDPTVGAISDAQAETTRRFARAQVANFMRRTEQLHNGGGQAGLAMGMTLNSRDSTMGMRERPTDKGWGLAITDRMRGSGEDPAIGQFANNPQSPLSRADQLGYGRTIGPNGTAPGNGAPKKAADTNEDGTRRTGSVATWAGGAIDIGTRDKTTDRSKVTATTAGLSAGADIKLGTGIVVGLGGGYGNDLSRIGTGAQVRGTSTLYAAYASIEPTEGAFIDGVVGRGQLDFTTRRIAAAVDATARGSRDGDYTVAAISLGIDRAGKGPLSWSIYGRGEYMDADLNAYVESGAGRYNLRFDARQVRSITGTLGGRIEYRQKVGFGSITPRIRAEWNHEFADVDQQWLDYADIPGAAAYALTGNGWKREQLQLSLGTRFDILKGGWSFDGEIGLRAGQGEKAGTLQLRLTKTF